MDMLQLLPIIAYVGTVVVVLMVALKAPGKNSFPWVLPALLGGLFVVFSLVTVAKEGLLQFWINHSTSYAGNQVWFDLLFAVTIGFYLIAPRARAVGMQLVPWSIAVVLTACVALLPMLARMIWLEKRAMISAGE